MDPKKSDDYDDDAPFVIEGKDIYTENESVYYGVLLLTLLYMALLFCQWVTVQNINIVHTYFSNPSAPGILYSERYTSRAALAIEFMSLRIFLFMCYLCLIIFRKSRSWFIFWISCISALVLFQIVAFGMLSAEYANANKDGNRYGIASDPWFCCAPDLHANPANFCVNPLPCNPPVWAGFGNGDLSVNTPFYYLYSVNLGLFLIDLGILCWIIVLWWSTTTLSQRPVSLSSSEETRVVEPPLTVPLEVSADPSKIEGEIKLRAHGIKPRTPVARKR